MERKVKHGDELMLVDVVKRKKKKIFPSLSEISIILLEILAGLKAKPQNMP